MERDGQLDLVDAVPQRLHLAQVVVEVVHVGRPEHRLGRQAQALESERCAALDLRDGLVERPGRDAGHRGQPVVVVGELLPGPLVVGPAHGVAEVGIGRGPDAQAFVREQDLGVAAVQRQVSQPGLGAAPGLVAQLLVAFEGLRPVELGRSEPLGLLEELLLGRAIALTLSALALALAVVALGALAMNVHGLGDGDGRQPVVVRRVDAVIQKRVRLLHMTVCRAHEELVVGIRPCRAQPPLIARSLQPPHIVDVGFRNGDRHVGTPGSELRIRVSVQSAARPMSLARNRPRSPGAETHLRSCSRSASQSGGTEPLWDMRLMAHRGGGWVGSVRWGVIEVRLPTASTR